MTAAEIKAALFALKSEMGPKAETSLSITAWNYEDAKDGKVQIRMYPRGLGQNVAYAAVAETFEEAISKAHEIWLDSKDRCHAEAVRNMALAIIKITADHGACSDFNLRADKFSQEDIDLYSKEAIADANAIASNGPFSIVRSKGANAA